MKKIFTLLFALLSAIILHAQVCTTTGFDVCTSGSGITSDFRNAVLITGTGSALTVGAKYKFNNAIPSLNLDAVISIDAMVNATMTGASSPNIDDDNSANETNLSGSQASLFAPRIAPNQTLSCTSRSGYVEFTVKFYTHYTGNAAPAPGTEIAVSNLNFLHFDMDGFTQGNNGWYKETGYVKIIGTDPINYGAAGTELTSSGNNAGWLLTYGSTTERNGVARCAEVIEKTIYSQPQAAISFRMGYDYKAPTSNCSSVSIQPTRQYGSRFGCFNLPAGGPLPVSLINLAVNYNTGNTTISWTSLQEHNLDSYEIQRSFDGTNFEVAGNISANNLTSVQQYKFTDNVAAFNSKYIYYRIRIVDLDHSMKLTNTVSVKIADWRSNEMTISPNPSTTNAQIRIKLSKPAAGDIAIFDATGKAIQRQKASLLAGNNNIIINNITALPEGYYTVRLIANDEVYSTKLLIWK
ncbi:T9SS type A sorting domain-containing protein [Ferruginibacter sp.]|nr:T9SS type A sorting domain-containing protein [Ferruginibacter sp.]